ncbi:Ff.00g050310.m01.CDS01 [Fusarium sp. VM40]|nr:Ff.00g050310.m01.CDS01 [Fusarium sp. VM40]
MSAVRFTRAATRATAQLRAPLQRRFASTTENEFIKERQHIKEHATGTTAVSPPALSPLVPTPTGSGTSIGSTGATCLLWRSAPSTPTRTSVPRTTSGVTETSWNDEVNYHNKDKAS